METSVTVSFSKKRVEREKKPPCLPVFPQQGDDGQSGSPGKTGRVGRRVRDLPLFPLESLVKTLILKHKKLR